jgi:hypothetical protein
MAVPGYCGSRIVCVDVDIVEKTEVAFVCPFFLLLLAVAEELRNDDEEVAIDEMNAAVELLVVIEALRTTRE